MVFRSGLEGWFDDIMDRLAGAYKRWTQWILLSVGLLLAVAFNISAVRLVDSLWNDAALRAAAADSAVAIANNAVENQDTECLPTVAPPTSVTPAASATPVPLEQCIAEKVEGAIGQVGALEVPMGWGSGFDGYEWYWTALGWIPMGLATMIGAPFWFDLLVRLAGIRESRGKPSRAPDDPASATAQVSKGNGSSLRVRPAWDELFPPSGEGPDSPGAAL